MPLKLVPPREGRSPYWRVRGTHLGVYLDRSAKTREREVAARFLRQWRGEIESGALRPGKGTTFADAALAYMRADGERRFVQPLLRYFGEMPVERIDQRALDEAAEAILPRAKPATRNRQVYTPVCAILNHVSGGHLVRFHRPKSPTGRIAWCEPDEIEALFRVMSPKLRRLAIFLLYTGCRISEATALDWSTVSLEQGLAYLATTKNAQPRGVYLPAVVVAQLAAVKPKKGRVFGYRGRGSVAKRWREAATAAGLAWVTPHVMRHTWATWMRQYGGADLQDLVATGAWRNIKGALRYTHVVPGEAAKAADLLPLSKLLSRAKTVERKRRALK